MHNESNLYNLFELISLAAESAPFVAPETNTFRALNYEEMVSVRRWDRRHSYTTIGRKGHRVLYLTQKGGLTICVLRWRNTYQVGAPIEYSIGVSRCSVSDTFNPIRGRMLAFRRALDSKDVFSG